MLNVFQAVVAFAMKQVKIYGIRPPQKKKKAN